MKKNLKNILVEGKRMKVAPDTYLQLISLTEKLWELRNKKFTKKTIVDGLSFKTSDGADGYIKVIINPRLKHIGQMETKPQYSRDPMDFVMELQPKEFQSQKNLFLTIYHELMHATDPSQSTKLSPKYLATYNEESDAHYWGHPIEFRAITNEFLEGLVNEFDRRSDNPKPEKIKVLKKSLENIKSYFSKNYPLTKFSIDIIQRINDEMVGDNRISKVLAELPTIYPGTEDFVKQDENSAYYLTYVEMIKEHNPKIWPQFLTMFYNTTQEINELLDKKLKIKMAN